MGVLMAVDRALSDARRGDEDAFDALLSPLLDPAFRLATVMLDGRSDAEDAVQEAAVKAWSRLAGFRGDGVGFRPWFLAVVVNECRMARRRPWWRVIRLAQPERAGDAAPGSERDVSPGDVAAERVDLARAIAGLAEEDRLALFLHFYLDLSLAESARVMRVPVATAKSRIYRAARRLRPAVAAEEVFDR